MRIIIKTYQFMVFAVFYIYKMLQANIYIAYDILTPKMRTNPIFVWIPLRVKSDFGVLLFSNLLSMTPGTLSVDIDTDKNELLVHILYNTSNDDAVAQIEDEQDRIIKLIQ